MNISKIKNNKKIKKLIIWLVVILLIITTIFCYLNFHVNPMIIATNEATIKAKTSKILNSAVLETFNKSNNYDELITINYNSNGDIQTINANTKKVNMLNTEVIKNCHDKLEQINNLSFDVPLGTFTGIPLFNGLGPNIKLKMMPIGTVDSNFKSIFNSVGINQTHHKIYINLESNVSILLPGNNSTVKINTQILVAESVIVGEVPTVYFGPNNNLDSQLNLIP